VTTDLTLATRCTLCYQLEKPAPITYEEITMVKVLFVCLGNICRSPMADGIFQHLVQEAGLSNQIQVDSAGTSSWHAGERAHPGTRKILKDHGIAYNGRSRSLRLADYTDFDYILAMDSNNYANIMARRPDDSTATIRMFLSYANGVNETDVPDPYYSGNFEYVYDLVHTGAAGLLAAIRREHNL
jgi:protein-tyrosine phosphatase